MTIIMVSLMVIGIPGAQAGRLGPPFMRGARKFVTGVRIVTNITNCLRPPQ